jgi:prepilin-type N-terminal cleavage/methylation domain-containing protein
MLFKYKFFSPHNSSATSKRGFGLVELMVSISIMTLVSTVILVKNRSFNNALLLRNQAYEVAFSLRQVQLLAVSGNKESLSDSNQYGLYIDISGADSDKYRLFRDDSNAGANLGRYDGGDELIAIIGNLDSRFEITSITNSSGTVLDPQLSITFVRPNFDALFKDSSGGYFNGPIYLNIATKESPTATRSVEVTSTGQITVK